MNLLSSLRPAKGSFKKRKRLGRGESSGLGKTSGRGHKGQKARAGGYHKVGFEGGQMPLQRRLPKRGFHPLNKIEFQLVNLSSLAKLSPNTDVTAEVLFEKGFIKKKNQKVKILGTGDLPIVLKVTANAFSKSAQEKIEKAGGQIIKV